MENIKFFPSYKNVFIDENLKYYFKPICTIGNYHFLTVDGIFCIKNYKYSENDYFGFKLKDGKYEFLGNLDCFGNNEIEKLYEILEKDFEKNKKDYLSKKIKIADYVKNIFSKIGEIKFDEEQDLEYYIESFYCYNMAKYYYELNKKIVSVKALTENYGITPEDELFKNPFGIKDKSIKFPTYSEYDYNSDKVYIFKLNNDRLEKCWAIKPRVKRDKTSYADKILLKIAEILSSNDRKIIKKLELILEDFYKYLKNNENFYYISNDINSISQKEMINLKVVATVLLLSENGYICYLDWKCELEDFEMIIDVMKKIGIDKNICNLDKLNLNEDDDIEVWSKKFNKILSEKDIFIGNINTNSDSYSIFPISKENLEKLRELGKKINTEIDILNYSEEEKDMDKNWLEIYEKNKEKFKCKIDLESYFNEKKIGEMEVDTLNIGEVNFPTGEILACDPLVELEDAKTYIQKVPVGKYPVKIAVVPSKEYGDRYACVKVEFNKNKPIVYELAVTGNEKEMDEAKEDEFYGFGVDAGMGCVVDKKTQEEYIKYWKKLKEDEEVDNPYDDIFEELLEESFKKFPKYQRDCGDWANFIIPNTDLNIPVFASGWGDGYYPSYFGYDEKGELCGFYIHFIDIEKEYSDEEEEE